MNRAKVFGEDHEAANAFLLHEHVRALQKEVQYLPGPELYLLTTELSVKGRRLVTTRTTWDRLGDLKSDRQSS